MEALIIDDNPLNADVLVLLLQQQGIHPVALSEPNELESVMATVTPSVIFLDLEFPRTTGFDALKIIQADERLHDVPVVAYTVHISEVDTARTAGFHSFLGKPLSAQKFPAQLKRILAGEQVWDPYQ
ncbi:MAG TPA: response regulator [Aggregatilineales bacterium]|nr:response regulator [Anaerolineales bacterium]HRE49429.1 response regulator [Aggregatilineales bacterium]